MTQESLKHKGWYSRGYVPHFDSPFVIQHVTLRLIDSLPNQVLFYLEKKLNKETPENRDLKRRKRIEQLIDNGYGSCILLNDAAAQLVQESILYFDGIRYRIFSWVIMPNHLHVLFQEQEGWSLPRIVQCWKKFTGRKLLPLLRQHYKNQNVSGFWSRDYWDRYIRNEEHFNSVKAYIHQNPVHAGLVKAPHEWRWSSAANEKDR